MKILIRNGRVIDPASNFDQVCDVAIAEGRIVSIKAIASSFSPARVIDASGCIVAPCGGIDQTAVLDQDLHGCVRRCCRR